MIHLQVNPFIVAGRRWTDLSTLEGEQLERAQSTMLRLLALTQPEVRSDTVGVGHEGDAYPISFVIDDVVSGERVGGFWLGKIRIGEFIGGGYSVTCRPMPGVLRGDDHELTVDWAEHILQEALRLVGGGTLRVVSMTYHLHLGGVTARDARAAALQRAVDGRRSLRVTKRDDPSVGSRQIVVLERP